MRRIVSIAGPLAQFAIADDGTGWFWTGSAWTPWERGPLPQPADVLSLPMTAREVVAQQEANEDLKRRMDELDKGLMPTPGAVPAWPEPPAGYRDPDNAQDQFFPRDTAPAVQRRGRPRREGA